MPQCGIYFIFKISVILMIPELWILLYSSCHLYFRNGTSQAGKGPGKKKGEYRISSLPFII